MGSGIGTIQACYRLHGRVTDCMGVHQVLESQRAATEQYTSSLERSLSEKKSELKVSRFWLCERYFGNIFV